MSAPRHVLICDEEREARSALAAHLEHHGFRVSVTAGMALTRALERARIDLVILAVQLGEGDALRAFRGLRAASDVPLVILARCGDEVDRIVGLEMGADDYLVKPVNPRELLARLRNILRRAGSRRRAGPGARAGVPLWRLAAGHRGATALGFRRAAREPAQLGVPRARIPARTWQPRGFAPQAHRAGARSRCSSPRSQHRRVHQSPASGSRRRCARPAHHQNSSR